MPVAGLLLATVFAPLVLARVLRRTRAWWVTGLMIAGVGAYLLLTLDHADHHGDGSFGAWYDIGNFLQTMYGVFMLVYAAILLLASHYAWKSRPQPPSIPPAKVV